MNVPKLEELNSASCREVAIKKKYPEFHKYLSERYYGQPLSFAEKLCLHYLDLDVPPVCVVCGAPVKFVNFKQGYRRTCCIQCQGKDPETHRKREEACMKKYGVPNAGKAKAVQYKMRRTCLERYGVPNGGWTESSQEKIKTANRERYGVDFPMQNTEIREKSRCTCLEKYGCEHNTSNPDIKEKVRQTNLERYGGTGYASPALMRKVLDTVSQNYGTGPIDNPSQVPCIMDKIRQSQHNTFIERIPELIGYTPEGNWICKCPHPECTKCREKYYITDPHLQRGREGIGAELCTKLLPRQSQYSTLELKVRAILDKYGIEYRTGVRDIIPPKELDIYIPSHSLAIECNGIYWHDSAHKSPKYHMEKTAECERAGVRLMHIWEDWIVNTPAIVESMLLNRLGLSPCKIAARKCEIRDVDPHTANEFLNANHIQGRSAASVRLGLYCEDQLVSLMTFGKRRGCMGNVKSTRDGEWELVRFCSRLFTQVVGGASKLLAHFIAQYGPEKIVSFASCDISQGSLYKRLGFVSTGEVTHSYWYIEPETMRRYHRSAFTKSAIVARGWMPDKNGWTEAQVMEALGYVRLDDAGQTKWELVP